MKSIFNLEALGRLSCAELYGLKRSLNASRDRYTALALTLVDQALNLK